MGISSMAFTSSVIFSVEVPVVVDSIVTSSAMAGEDVGAKDATSVEGNVVVTMGMVVIEVVENSLCLD